MISKTAKIKANVTDKQAWNFKRLC